jgi:hypothetical protein
MWIDLGVLATSPKGTFVVAVCGQPLISAVTGARYGDVETLNYIGNGLQFRSSTHHSHGRPPLKWILLMNRRGRGWVVESIR